MSRVGQGPLPGYESPSINRPNSFTVSGPVTTDGVAVFTIQAGQNVTLQDGKFSYDKTLLDNGNLQKFSASGDNGSAVSGQRILNWGTTAGLLTAGRAIYQNGAYTATWGNIIQNDISRQDNPVMFKTNEGEMVTSGVREGLVKMYQAQNEGKGFLTGTGQLTNDWTTIRGNIFQMGYGLGDGAGGDTGNVVYADFSQITKYPLDFLDPDQRWFAFSTRRLSYQAENCMEVYRNNDPNDTEVIGWDNNGYIDVSALGLFSAGAIVRVKTWYNQSGNGYHATVPNLATNPTRGPVIFPASGSVRTIGGNNKICLDFSAAQYLVADTGGTGDVDQPLWAAVVGATDQTSSGRYWFDGDDADRTFFYQSFDGGTPNTQRWAWGAGVYPETNLPGSKTDTDGHIFAMQFNGTTSSFKKDAQVIGYNLNVSTGDNDGLTIGNRYATSGNSQFDGGIAEIIMFSGSGAMAFDDNFMSKYLTNANTYYDIWAEFSTGLLDTYSGAAAAYSMRRLSSTYTGACLKVERSGDGTTKDIGFDEAGNLDVLTLLEFVGAGDGRVHTWFDQSGNGNDATQTDDAKQPLIVSSGSLIQQNEKPALEFDGVDDFMTSPDYIVELSQNPASVFCVSQASTVANSAYILAEGDVISPYSSNFILGGSTGSDIVWVNGTTVGTMQAGQVLVGFDYDQANATAFIDGSQSGSSQAVTVNTETSLYSYIGSRADGLAAFFNGKIQELITYKSDQSANRTGIETNINDYYDIY